MLHDWPPPHALPQIPQLALSAEVSMQDPLQHVSPFGQTFPHVPQLLVLVWRFWQVPPQFVVPPAQLPHDPLMQDTPEAQVPPHAPQLFGSVLVSTHALPQSVRPDAQWHCVPLFLQQAPLLQVWQGDEL
jgi:hypothetical protein